MKTNRPLLLSALFAVAAVLVSVCARADSEPSGDLEMQAALEQLDDLLNRTKTAEDAPAPDALSALQGLQAKFERLNAELAARDLELKTSAQALAEAEVRISDLDARLKAFEKPADKTLLTAQDARLKILEDESHVLKEEIERQHQRAEKAEDARQATEAETARLKEALATARAALEARPASEADPEAERLKAELAAALEARQASASEADRLKAELASAREAVSGLESRLAEKSSASIGEEGARDLTGTLEDMKAVDAQRKAAMDDLFRQLAAQKKDLQARDADVAGIREELARATAVIADRDRELGMRKEQLAAQDKALAEARAEQEAVNARLAEAGQAIKGNADALSLRESELQELQREMDRVKLVDEQRRQTLDETLAALAESRQRLGIQGGELEQLRGEHARAVLEADGRLSALADRKSVLDRELEQMEKDVMAASEARDAAQANIKELRVALTERDRQVVDLEQQVSRLTAVDDQRRKALDRVLLDVAMLEQEKGKLQAELKGLQLADLGRVAGEPSTALDAQLAEARREKETLLARIATLETALQAHGTEAVAGSPVPEAAGASPDLSSAWAQEKARMEAQLQALNDAMAKDAERLKQMEQDLGQARQASAELAEQVKALEERRPDIRESDLYKELEQINAMLREKMLEIESDRQRLAGLAETAAKREAETAVTIEAETQGRTKAEAALAEALAREAEYKELIERLVPQVEELEKQVTALAEERQELTNRLRERDEDLQSLKVELERREYRLAKAERVAEVLEKARTEVLQAGDREKLDMHYNMASVYAREGKFAEAEREYLQALRIDPTDADVHYNLGILYDDELKQPEKATSHYRRYLQLSPHGPDADRVRNWLMKLEMRTQR